MLNAWRSPFKAAGKVLVHMQQNLVPRLTFYLPRASLLASPHQSPSLSRVYERGKEK